MTDFARAPVVAGLFAALYVLAPSSAAAQTATTSEQALLGKTEVAAQGAVSQIPDQPRPTGESALLGRNLRRNTVEVAPSRQVGLSETDRSYANGERALLGRRKQPERS